MGGNIQIRLPTRWMIGLSIALNIFLLVFLGAQVWRYLHPDGLLASMTSQSIATGTIARTLIDRITSDLPADDVRLLRGAFVAKLPELVRLQHQSYLAVEQVRHDIGETPYDANKVRADLLAAREARQAIRSVIEGILLEALPRMSPEGRRALSEIRLLPEK